jgi:hypothetical protein
VVKLGRAHNATRGTVSDAEQPGSQGTGGKLWLGTNPAIRFLLDLSTVSSNYSFVSREL